MPSRAAVLFLIFNRPEHTRQSFEALRQARPPRLYIAADGPRAGRIGEVERCREAREVAQAVDWPCQVQTRFLKGNQGCRRAISSALAWFFEREEQGVVLEDDLVATPDFFTYTDALLERYRDEPRVCSINGSNYGYQPAWSDSYRFSIFMNMHGWATWRRSWQRVDIAMGRFAALRRGRIPHLYRLLHGSLWPFDRERLAWASYWSDRFGAVLDGRVDSWGYAWVYNALQLGMLSTVPRANLVRNIGWGSGATHTHGADDPRGAIPVQSLQFPLRAPEAIVPDSDYDRHAMETWARYRDLRDLRPTKTRLAADLAPEWGPRAARWVRTLRRRLT